MFEQKFGFSVMFFFVLMRQLHFDFYCFFRYFGLDFFLNGFSDPFIVHSRPSFFCSNPI